MQKLYFSEQCDVAYQIKGNQGCRNIVANILPADRTHPLIVGVGQKVKFQLFQNIVRLHIKLKGITNAAT